MMKQLGLLLVFLLSYSSAIASTIEVEGQGLGVTRAQALLEAKRDALSKGIGQVLVSQTEVENFMVKRDHILTKTMGHVKSFKKLSENQGPDQVWSIKIRAQVGTQGLKDDVAALLMLIQDIGNPRLAFLIQETNMGNSDPAQRKTVETALTQFFKSKSFDVVDPSAVLRASQNKNLSELLQGNPEVAAQLGQAVNADVIIIGSAVATEADMSNHSAFKNSAMKSASAQLSLKAINVSNRRVLTAADKQIAQIHPNVTTAGDRAFKKAVKILTTKKGMFFDQLVEAWRQSAQDGQTISVEIQGLSKFSQAKQLRFYFQGIAQQVNQRSFKKPTLNLDMNYVGQVEALCETVDGHQVEGVGTLSVESYAGHSVKLKLNPAQ